MARLIEITCRGERGKTAIVRGGGDLATGVIYRLWRAGFAVLCLETVRPLAVRRPVLVAQAVFDGEHSIEEMRAVRIGSAEEFAPVFERGAVAVLVDLDGDSASRVRPDLLVDAIMAKRNTGTHRKMAKLVLAIGPGFTAPDDVHGVVETKRGHFLGRLITNGAPAADTGLPGMEMGYTSERLLRAPADGYVEPVRGIGDHVAAGHLIAAVGGVELRAQIPGVLRGLIHPSVRVVKGMKIGDIDPRNEASHCFSITDKALSVAGGILEGLTSIEIPEHDEA